jgi:hypothetical protein
VTQAPPASPTPPWAAPNQAAPTPPAWGAPPPPPAGAPAPGGYWAAPVPPAQPKSGINPALVVLVIALIAAIAGGAYVFASQNKGAGASPSAPTASGPIAQGSAKPGTSSGPGASGAAPAGTGLSGAVTALSDIESYKFTMTVAGGDFGSALSALGGSSSSGNSEFTISGTIVESPSKGADVTIAGIHMVEIDGYDYVDLTGSGSFIKTEASGTSMADSMSPASMFSGMMGASTAGWDVVGSESKNGVDTSHYQATESALAEFGTESGVDAATWTGDIWVANNGGYPVSMAILGTASDGTVAYEIKFDITNINDPANKVAAPTNVISS